jgi:hypothetical protein
VKASRRQPMIVAAAPGETQPADTESPAEDADNDS